MLVKPRRARWYAALAPMQPPPMMTTSAVLLTPSIYARPAVKSKYESIFGVQAVSANVRSHQLGCGEPVKDGNSGDQTRIDSLVSGRAPIRLSLRVHGL